MANRAIRADTVPDMTRGHAALARSNQSAILALALLAAVLYIVHPPAVPDLAAQVARVDASRAGGFLWWSGWFGGLQLPAYSALSPVIMASLGVSVAAAISALGVTGLGFALFRNARHPIAGIAVLSAAAFADILAGRVTFALGATAAVASVVLIRRRSAAMAAVAAGATFLLSPLAGLFLGMVALAVALADRDRRRAAAAVALTLVGAGVIQAALFPGAGQMPYPWWHMAIALLTAAVVAAVCPDRTVRVGCAVVAAATVLFFLVPGPVGTNVVRLVWLAAAPTVAATSRLRRLPMLVLVAALAVWPAIDLGVQLDRASSPAAQSSFFSPLVTALHQQASVEGARARGERVELVEPASQWGAAYVAPTVPIARGWDRPTDRADNALFYNGTLTATTYRAWLKSMSVGWVALPLHVPLDYASVQEAQLVLQRPPYLRLMWQNSSWQLFRVVGAQPLIRGATLVSSNGGGITFRAASKGPVDIDVRWSPYLKLGGAQGVAGACIVNRKPWTQIIVPRPGTYTLQARFAAYPASHSSCAAS